MDTLVIQSGVKHGRIAEITRSNGARLRVGRGYDNDIVLTDRHVAVLLHLNLVIASNLLRARVTALALSALLVSVFYGFSVFGNAEADPLLLPDYSQTLAPPPLSTLKAGSAETYFGRVAGALDRLARQE